jgi:hypothetical protein
MNREVTLARQESSPAAVRRLNHLHELPPADKVPILKEYGRIGLERFIDRYAVPTQTDDRGFVDYGWLLGYIDGLVSKEHVWTGRLDIHHLQWEAGSYIPANFTDQTTEDRESIDPTIPHQFRENPFHKLLIPRDMHDLIHLVTLPPEVPDYEQMKRRVDAYTIAINLFQKAKQTLDIEAQEKRLQPINHPRFADMSLDPKKRRVINREILLDRYAEFVSQFRAQLSNTSQNDVDNLIRMDILLGQDPIPLLVSSMERKIRLHKDKQAIRPTVRWAGGRKKNAA